MGKILKDIYLDISISPLIGLKGGTCAYFFYNLPRFSVDLDFDLFDNTLENQELIFDKIKAILLKYGQIKDSYLRKSTIFAVLSYGQDDYNIKIEINVRGLVPNIKRYYDLKEHLGISMFVANEAYLFSSKLVALTLRKKVAMRDVYDIHYFAENNWDIDGEIIKIWTNKSIKEYLSECVSFIEKLKDSEILANLGELVPSEKEKDWVRNHLKSETIFMLRNYISVMK